MEDLPSGLGDRGRYRRLGFKCQTRRDPQSRLRFTKALRLAMAFRSIATALNRLRWCPELG